MTTNKETDNLSFFFRGRKKKEERKGLKKSEK